MTYKKLLDAGGRVKYNLIDGGYVRGQLKLLYDSAPGVMDGGVYFFSNSNMFIGTVHPVYGILEGYKYSWYLTSPKFLNDTIVGDLIVLDNDPIEQPEKPEQPKEVVVTPTTVVGKETSKMKVKPAEVKKLIEAELKKYDELVEQNKKEFDSALLRHIDEKLAGKTPAQATVSKVSSGYVLTNRAIFTDAIQQCALAAEELVELHDLLCGYNMARYNADSIFNGTPKISAYLTINS